jgi:hypothetical protein
MSLPKKAGSQVLTMMAAVVRILQTLPESHSARLANFCAALYIGGLLVFFMKAWFTDFMWAEAYYTWDKSLTSFLFLFILLKIPNNVFLIINIYALINALWEIMVWILGADINSMIIVDVWFIITVIVIISLTLIQNRECKRKSSY